MRVIGPLAHHGKWAIFDQCSDFFGPWKKWPGLAPKEAGRLFFRPIQTVPTFWATSILISIIFIFEIFWIPNFWISRFQIFKIWLGPGWAWARISSLVRCKELGSGFETSSGVGGVWKSRILPSLGLRSKNMVFERHG